MKTLNEFKNTKNCGEKHNANCPFGKEKQGKNGKTKLYQKNEVKNKNLAK